MIPPPPLLVVTGLSGAGKTTALKTLEALGWDIIDNLPVRLLDRLSRDAEGPLALGLGSATRGFDADAIRRFVAASGAELLFLDCADAELERRFSATRARHPLADDRPAAAGIARERGMLRPLHAGADHLLDTTGLTANALQGELRRRFGSGAQGATAITVQSFSFARGLPTGADLVFDMRFLRNPHWVDALRPRTGRDPEVAAYIAGDPAYGESLERMEALLLLLLPRYVGEGKSYVTVAFGCTGGKHRSVHAAERVAARLRGAGFSITLAHRDLGSALAETGGAPAVQSGDGG